MFNLIRRIHLFAAFILTVFVLMYFITGFIMIFEETFKRTDNSVTSVVKEIPGIQRHSGDTLIALLRSNFEINGQYQIRKNNTQTVLDFRHPGTESQVIVRHGSDSVKVTTKKKNFISTMHQFHRLHGYHGGLNYLVWAFVYDLSALSMILFAITGVYLWYKTEHTKWPGWLIITAFTFFMFFTMVYLSYLE
ncbi:MAG: PepSY-associated TM helix domain-containing protein [Cyclobacteriaceae bacterium]